MGNINKSITALFGDYGHNLVNNMDNSKQWSSKTPGYIIFLVDQSGSMKESYPEKGNKANFTALVINRTIHELIEINADGEKPKDRVFITIVGYGGKGGDSVEEIRSDFLSDFSERPIRIEAGKQKISDGNGGLIEINVNNPIFIEPVANGLTPMGSALEYAKRLIEDWLSDKPNNPAPVIINVSDGLPYSNARSDEESKAIEEATAIMNLSCDDGNPLIFNAHIGDDFLRKCTCSSSESELPDNQAKFLFRISSKIPESYKKAAEKNLGLTVQPNSRGFVSNADPETFIKFINFGSSGGTDKTTKMSNNDQSVSVSNSNTESPLSDNDPFWNVSTEN